MILHRVVHEHELPVFWKQSSDNVFHAGRDVLVHFICDVFHCEEVFQAGFSWHLFPCEEFPLVIALLV